MRFIIVIAAVVATALTALGCGGPGSENSAAGKRVVVTTSILGAVVSELVGDGAEVSVLMPDGVDPHDWEPSAKAIEAVHGADVVVANGLDLEEGLEGALSEAARHGVTVFEAADHVELRTIADGEVAEDHHGEDERGEGAEDPHLWLDPLAMRSVVRALGPVLAEARIDVGDRVETVSAALERLNAEAAERLERVPAERRKLVTGHESLGYFADRYGFVLVGAVVPSLTSQAETSAGALAALRARIEEAGVAVVFTELGTPRRVVDAIADETGAEVVELATHRLPADGTYRSFLLEIVDTIAGALAPP
jgi:zinc/manganese transport system substrate-binding protein